MGFFNKNKRSKKYRKPTHPVDTVSSGGCLASMWLSDNRDSLSFTLNRIVRRSGEAMYFRAFRPEDVRDLAKLLANVSEWLAHDALLNARLRSELTVLSRALRAAEDALTSTARSNAKALN